MNAPASLTGFDPSSIARICTQFDMGPFSTRIVSFQACLARHRQQAPLAQHQQQAHPSLVEALDQPHLQSLEVLLLAQLLPLLLELLVHLVRLRQPLLVEAYLGIQPQVWYGSTAGFRLHSLVACLVHLSLHAQQQLHIKSAEGRHC
jgi:hypothetical protein